MPRSGARCLGLDDDPGFTELLRVALDTISAEGDVHDREDSLRRQQVAPVGSA